MKFKFNTKYTKIDAVLDNIKPFIKSFKFKEYTEYYVIIEEAKAKRSLPQNKYYWGVVIKILAEHFGYTSEEMHQLLGNEFLCYDKNGHVFVKSTTKLNTKEFTIFIDKVRQWADNDFKIPIPLPNEITNEIWQQIQERYPY